MERVFVTGGTGFVGRAVVRALVGAGHEVRVLARTAASAEKARGLGATPVAGDLLDDQGAWTDALRTADRVVHAAQPSVPSDAAARARMDLALVRALATLDGKGVRRAVFVLGSSWYGRTAPGETLDEDAPPRAPVGIGASFGPCLAALRASRLEYACAFVGAVYGRGSWFVRLWRGALDAGVPVVLRDPAPRWPFVHVADVARAVAHLAFVDGETLARHGRDVIVANPAPEALDVFVDALAARLGRPARLERVPGDALAARLGVSSTIADYLGADLAHVPSRLARLGFVHGFPDVRSGVAALDL